MPFRNFRLVKSTVTKRSFDKASQVLQLRNEAHKNVLQFHVGAARVNFQSRVVTSVPEKVNGELPSNTILHVIPPISDDLCERCPINTEFLHRIIAWSSTLDWETHRNGETSYLEHTLDYIFASGTYPPLPIPKIENRN